MLSFRITHEETGGRARVGVLTTARSEVATPAFMPVGSLGNVRSVDGEELLKMGYGLILNNAYHLYLRPGHKIVEELGGVHRFTAWPGSILTDSGGFQIFSLKEIMKLSEEGAAFSSHIDGSKHFFSPERVMEIQRCIGSDIMMLLDECTPYPATHDYAKSSMERSMRWAQRCKTALETTEPRYGARQFAFGIGQGSVFKDLRRESLETLCEIGFDGYAIGGLAVGEKADVMYDIVDFSTDFMPKEQPRYLMGVGTPQNKIGRAHV